MTRAAAANDLARGQPLEQRQQQRARAQVVHRDAARAHVGVGQADSVSSSASSSASIIARAAQPMRRSHQPGMRPSSRTRIGISAITNSRPGERVGANGWLASRKYIAVTMRR